MHADFDLAEDGQVHASGHGGARRGAGRKGADYVKTQEVLDFDKARARNETSKANMNELEYKIKSGEYVARAAVQQASATAIATLAQSMRSIPDNLERKGIPAEACQLVERVLEEAMAGMAADLEMMSGAAI